MSLMSFVMRRTPGPKRFSFHLVLCLKSLALWLARMFSLVSASWREDGCVHMHLVASWTGLGIWDTKWQAAFSLSDCQLPWEFVIRGPGSWGVFVVSTFIYCKWWKSAIPVVPDQCHWLVRLWLEASHVPVGNLRHFCNTPFLLPETMKGFALMLILEWTFWPCEDYIFEPFFERTLLSVVKP